MKFLNFLGILVVPCIMILSSCGKDGEPEIPPQIGFLTASSSAKEGETITVEFTQTLPGGVTPVFTLSGSAVKDTDYTQTPNGLVFTLLDDGLYDPDETIIITLTGFNGKAQVSGITTHTITIKETPLTIEFSSQNVTRVEGTAVSATFNQSLPAGVTVTFTITGTATQTTDFTYTQNQNGFVVTTKTDQVYDPNETIIIELTGVTGNTVLGTKKIYTVTITDEDDVAGSPAAGLKIDLSWEANGSLGDVDMDLLVWLETSPGVYTAVGGLWSTNIGQIVESTTIPGTESNGTYGISYIYYSGTSDNLKVNVSMRSYKGNINVTSNRATYTATYKLVNINAYTDPYTQPDVVGQTFEKAVNNYINVTGITVAANGSRASTVEFFLDDEARRKIQWKQQQLKNRFSDSGKN